MYLILMSVCILHDVRIDLKNVLRQTRLQIQVDRWTGRNREKMSWSCYDRIEGGRVKEGWITRKRVLGRNETDSGYIFGVQTEASHSFQDIVLQICLLFAQRKTGVQMGKKR